MTGLEIASWGLVVVLILNFLVSIMLIGKPRKPLTGGIVIFAGLFNLAFVLVLLAWLGVI